MTLEVRSNNRKLKQILYNLHKVLSRYHCCMKAFIKTSKQSTTLKATNTNIFEHISIIKAKEKNAQEENIKSLKKAADEIKMMLEEACK